MADVSKKKSKLKQRPRPAPPISAALRQWSAEEKVRVVLAAAAVSDQNMGEFLRREGLHEEGLVRFQEEVRSAAIAGLTPAKKAARGEEQKRIKELERELKRKEAALAETAALLVLRNVLGRSPTSWKRNSVGLRATSGTEGAAGIFLESRALPPSSAHLWRVHDEQEEDDKSNPD